MKRILISAVFFLCVFLFSNNPTYGQCYIIHNNLNGTCYCTTAIPNGQAGYCACDDTTYHGLSCFYTSSTSCYRFDPQGLCGPIGSPSPIASVATRVLVIDDLTIQQIAAAHPRFAATLATLARTTATNPDTLRFGEFSWAPVKLK